MIRGIGPVYARKLVKAFGANVFDVIEAEPDRLREVIGIGPMRATRITGAWAEQKIVREIMVFLHSHGVGTARAVRFFKTYGADAVQVMTDNPYRLARDIRGIGFKTADAIAMKLGVDKAAMIRVRAGISYALAEAMDEGHCGLPTEELAPLAATLLEVPAELVQTALDLELAEGTVVANAVGETACIFLAGLYRAERVIAERIRCLANGVLPWPAIDPEKALPWIEQKTGLSLAEGQAASIRQALLAKVFVITGGPGVGKTAIVNSILRILAAKGVGLSLCAPTGRAAKRMTEATGFEAKTIHRLLEIDPKTGGFRRDSDNPIECDPSGRRRDLDGGCHADASAAAGRSRHRRLADRRRHRPASIGRTRSSPGRHHRLRRGPDRPPDRGVPAGGGEPDHHQCEPDQPRSDAGSN
jgi:exodeoxyribonuclease V alpha subunit